MLLGTPRDLRNASNFTYLVEHNKVQSLDKPKGILKRGPSFISSGVHRTSAALKHGASTLGLWEHSVAPEPSVPPEPYSIFLVRTLSDSCAKPLRAVPCRAVPYRTVPCIGDKDPALLAHATNSCVGTDCLMPPLFCKDAILKQRDVLGLTIDQLAYATDLQDRQATRNLCSFDA